jgi:hypothetical protein
MAGIEPRSGHLLRNTVENPIGFSWRFELFKVFACTNTVDVAKEAASAQCTRRMILRSWALRSTN